MTSFDDELDGFDDVLDTSVDTTYTGKAPAGLIALCIITIVGSALILFKDLFTYSFYAALANETGRFNGGISRNPDLGWIPIIYLVEVLSCLGTLTAAILMLKLNKIGYVIYNISTGMYALSVVWFWLVVIKVEMSEWMVMLFLLYLAVPIAFVIMYGANRKYLR